MSEFLSKELVQSFFSHQERQISMFLAVEQLIHSLGPVKSEVMKSKISFGTTNNFAWVWMYQPWVNKPPENSIVLTFCVNHYIENEKIVEAVERYPGRWVHHVVIQTEADLDNYVSQWLREAYTFSQNRK